VNALERLEKLAERGTERPWRYGVAGFIYEQTGTSPVAEVNDIRGADVCDDNADLIVAAVNALPDLIAALKAAQRVMATLDAHISLPFPDSDECRGGMHWELPCEPIGTDGPALRAALTPLLREVGSDA
jgi:hypothetical protein